MANYLSTQGDNNMSLNSNESSTSPDKRLKLRLALGIEIAMFVVAVLGNFLVLLVIYRTRERRKTPFEILIANLSVADILTVFVYLIYHYARIPVSKWYCKLVTPFSPSTQMVSMLTMTTIAIFRCRSIVDPFKTKPSTKLTCCTVLGLWILANVCLLPVYVVAEKSEFGWCREVWPSQLLNKVYTVSLAVVQYVIPLTIMAVCYTRIVVYLKRHRGPQCDVNNDRINQMKMKRKRDMEVIKISLVIVLLFSVSTLPSQIAWIGWVVFENYVISNAIAQFSYQLSLLHCCCNPFVYGVISREFRSRIFRVLWSITCYVCRMKRRQSGVLPTEQGQGNDLKMIDIKEYVKRDEAARVNASTPTRPADDRADSDAIDPNKKNRTTTELTTL